LKRKKKIVPKSKEYIEDISDIILNAESDDAAIAFLKDSIIDDFPDLDLGSMDLHEASKVLSDTNRKKRKGPVVGLNEALGKFIEDQQRKKNEREKAKRSQERRRNHHRKKNKNKKNKRL